MPRSARFTAILQATLLLGALALPATAAASSPTAATLTILDAGCSGAAGTIVAGATVCARAVVTVSATGTGDYRTSWFAPGAVVATFQDVHALSGSGSVTFEDAHQLATAGLWTVRACKNAACVSAASIMATKAFIVAGAPATAPTTLTVAPASGAYAGTTSLSAALTTSSGGTAVSGATIAFTLSGGSAGSAVTDATGVATLSGVGLGTTGTGTYPTAVGASFVGTTTHGASTGTGGLSVARASSTTSVTCAAGPFTFDGNPVEPCSASVTGAGGLSLLPTPGYMDNVDAGTATASYDYAGDTNHEPSSDTETFAIGRAASTTSVSCPPSVLYTGSAQTPCTASVSGAGGLDSSLDATYTGNVIGTATASAAYAGDANHDGSSASATFVIEFAWTGFDAPIGTPGHGAAGKGFKAGQTIPVKFAFWDAAGDPVRGYGNPTFSRTDSLGSCAGTPADGTAPAATPDAGSPFVWTGSQYHHNWSTKGLSAGLYRIFVDLADGVRHSQDVCLTR